MSARMGPEQGGEVGVCRRKHTEREFYKLTRMLLLGQVEPADSDFSSAVFLRCNGHTVINQMSGTDRHAKGWVQDLLFG